MDCFPGFLCLDSYISIDVHLVGWWVFPVHSILALSCHLKAVFIIYVIAFPFAFTKNCPLHMSRKGGWGLSHQEQQALRKEGEERFKKKCRRFISDGNAMCVWQRTHAGLIVATWFNAAALSYSSCGWLPFHICSSPWSQGMWTALVAVCPYNLIGQHQKYGELGARHYVGLVPLTLGLEFSFLRQGLTCVVVAILKLMM